MLADLLQSTRLSVKERLSSPLLGSFLISWTIWNWKFLVILLSADSVVSTFELARTHSFPDICAVLAFGILLPLASALAYVLLYPYPYRWVLEYSLKQQRLAAQVRQRIEEETPLTVEESRRIRVELVNMDRAHHQAVAELNEEIARLNAALDSATAELQKLINARDDVVKPEAISPVFTATELEVLKVLERGGKEPFYDDVLKRVDGEKIEIEVAIGDLVANDIISKSSGSLSGLPPTLSFTHKGRKAYLEARKRADA
jgi:hypothetical protein